jgi:hypothetical protein
LSSAAPHLKKAHKETTLVTFDHMLNDDSLSLLCFCAPSVEEALESVTMPLPDGNFIVQLVTHRFITHSEPPMHPRRGSSPHRRPRIVNYNFA